MTWAQTAASCSELSKNTSSVSECPSNHESSEQFSVQGRRLTFLLSFLSLPETQKGKKHTHTHRLLESLWQICWQERKQSKSTTYIKVIFLVISYFLPNLCAGAPYVSMMTVLACSRFHWQSCRSPSHSDLDLRPKRNNCSTCDPDRHTQGKFSFMLTPAVFFKLKSLKKKLPNSRK